MGENSGDDGGMVSFNHYANGAVGDWFYRRVAGIEPTSGGYKTFRIAPMPGGGLTHVNSKVKTPFGEVEVDWMIKDSCFAITVRVPVSTYCELILPDGQTRALQSGQYTYSCRM